MKERTLLGFVCAMLLSACVSQQDVAQQCPHTGIDVNAPNFSEKHKSSDIDSFYGCMMQATPELLYRPHGVLGAVAPSAMERKDLAYQWNLWKQVLAKDEKPLAAQQAWMVWKQNGDAARASEEAASVVSHKFQINPEAGGLNWDPSTAEPTLRLDSSAQDDAEFMRHYTSASRNAAQQSQMQQYSMPHSYNCMNMGGGMVNCQ